MLNNILCEGFEISIDDIAAEIIGFYYGCDGAVDTISLTINGKTKCTSKLPDGNTVICNHKDLLKMLVPAVDNLIKKGVCKTESEKKVLFYIMFEFRKRFKAELMPSYISDAEGLALTNAFDLYVCNDGTIKILSNEDDKEIKINSISDLTLKYFGKSAEKVITPGFLLNLFG